MRFWIAGNLEVTVIDRAPYGTIRFIQIASKITAAIESAGYVTPINETRLEE